MELRGLNISGTQDLAYTVQVFNFTKNKVLGSLPALGDKANFTVPFNNPSFNSTTDIASNDQILVRLLRENCSPVISAIYVYNPNSPVNFIADNATSTRYGLTRFITNPEREQGLENVAVDGADLLFYYRKDKAIFVKAGETIAMAVGAPPIFIEMYVDNDELLFKKATSRIDGAILSASVAGTGLFVFLANRSVLSGFVDLTVGESYGFNLTTSTVEPYSPSNIYIGKALGETTLQFDYALIESLLSWTGKAGSVIGNRTFVEIYTNGNGETLIRPAVKRAHGFNVVAKQLNQIGAFLRPNQSIKGFVGLLPGSMYAVENGSLVIYDPENIEHIPTAIAISTQEILFLISLEPSKSDHQIATNTLLTTANAVIDSSFNLQIPLTNFTLENEDLALATAISWPEQASVTKDSTKFTISWIPNTPGEFFVLFWVENPDKVGKTVSQKIVVSSTNIIPEGQLIIASTSLSAGMYVNIFTDGGVPKLRPAIAVSINTVAHGFVTQNAAAGQAVKFHSYGINPFLSSLTPGSRYLLSATVPGGITLQTPVPGSGLVWQPVGRAFSNAEILVGIDNYYLM